MKTHLYKFYNTTALRKLPWYPHGGITELPCGYVVEAQNARYVRITLPYQCIDLIILKCYETISMALLLY